MGDLSAAERVARRLEWQRNRFLVKQPDFYDELREYWRNVRRGYRRFWADVYRGRPWLDPLAIVVLATLFCWFGYLVYSGFFNRESVAKLTQPENQLNNEAVRFIFAALMLWVPVNYWVFCVLRFPLTKHLGQSAKNKLHLNRLGSSTIRNDLPLLVSKWLLLITISIVTVRTSFFSLLDAIGVVLVAALLWVGCRIVFKVGELVFTAWNTYSPDVPHGQWRYWILSCLSLLNLFALLSLTKLSTSEVLPHYNGVPVTGWFMMQAIEFHDGNWQAGLCLLFVLLMAIVADYGLKKCQQSFTWQRQYLCKTKMHQDNDPSFQRALEIANEDKEAENQLVVGGLADDLRRVAQRSMLQRCWARIGVFYCICLLLSSAFPVVLLVLMHFTIQSVPAQEINGFQLQVGLMYCVPVFAISGLVYWAGAKSLRVRCFWKSPLSLSQWWKTNFAHAVVMCMIACFSYLPAFVAAGLLYGRQYPWLMMICVIGYFCVVVISVWMIVASIISMSHLWCLMPKWVRWFEGELGGLLGLFFAMFLLISGILVVKASIGVSGSVVALMLAAPPLLAIVTMVYAYVLAEKLGDGYVAAKK